MALIDDIRAITGDDFNYRWNRWGDLGTNTVVTYSFPVSQPSYDTETRSGYTALSSAHQAHVRLAMATWEAVSGLKFVEVPADVGGDITFAMIDMTGQLNSVGNQLSGFAYFPSNYYFDYDFETESWSVANSHDDIGGDVFLNSNFYAATASSLAPGTRGYSIVLHEIGHAIGFKHPFEGDPTITPSHDNGTYTLLSYDRRWSDLGLGSVDRAALKMVYGENGIASYAYDAAANEVVVSLMEGTPFSGSNLGDRVTGTGADDWIYGSDGDDHLFGRGGEDTLLGGFGSDELSGANGNDLLNGGHGDDSIAPGNSDMFDLVIGSWGDDTVDYTGSTKGRQVLDYESLPAVDVVIDSGNNLAQVYKHGAGTDTLVGITPLLEGNLDFRFFISGTPSWDFFDIALNVDQSLGVFSTSGRDSYELSGGDVALLFDYATEGVQINLDSGIIGNDGFGNYETFSGQFVAVAGSAFNDVIVGSASDELFTGYSGNDQINGGGGNDLLTFDFAGYSSVSVDLGAGSATGVYSGSAFSYALSAIEEVIGSDLKIDVLTGSATGDILSGLGGADILSGMNGNDTLDGGEGNDQLFGGGDSDTLHGGPGDDDIFGNRGRDFIDPGAGADAIDGGGDFDRVWYGDSAGGVTVNLFTGRGSRGNAEGDTYMGVERVTGSSARDEITGTAVANALKGGSGNDTIYGLDGRDVIEGQDGRDTLYGGNSNDVVIGGAGNDVVYGNRGFDRIDGGLGDDYLTGGNDIDYFVFKTEGNQGFGWDHVTDFQDGADRLDVREVYSTSGSGLTANGFDKFTVTDTASGAKIKFEAGQVIYLSNFAAADVDAGDFIFS